MIRVGIIGCGKMADQHAAQILRIPGTTIVGVCDSEPLMAAQMAERFRISRHFSDPPELIAALKPDVVHITTPPESHYPLAKMALEAGCNAYVEKPFTLNTAEAEDLFEIAQRKGLKIIAGHNAQFTQAMVRMRQMVREGYLGGKPVHMESHYCYDFGDAAYAKTLLGDENHWIRRLPGSLLQNIISHGISRVAEFLAGDSPTVMAYGFTSPFLKSIGETGIVDEVRVIIRDEESMTAYFTFSSQIKPVPHEFRIYGPKNSLMVDDDHQVLISYDNREYKSYLRFFVPPLLLARQYVKNWCLNANGFIGRNFPLPNEAGLKTLINRFYDSIISNSPLPLSYREMIVTAKIMDSIFFQIGPVKRCGSAVPAQHELLYTR